MALPRPTAPDNIFAGVSLLIDELDRLLNGRISSANIADGTIVDADISPTAAIEPSKLAMDGFHAAASGAVTLTTAFQDVTGATFTTTTTGIHMLLAVLDMQVTTVGTGVLIGQFVIDGSAAGPQILLGDGATVIRATVAQNYRVSIASGKVVKLQAKKSIAAGVAATNQSHSTLTALLVG